jgi:hypothetical protein
MKQDKMSALLGRPLAANETANYKLYLDIANDSLESMICTSLCDQNDPKVYDVREGYSTVFTDIFIDIDEVKLDGKVVDSSEYSLRQWDKRNASWYNSLVFNYRFNECDKEVEVSATWGFESMPSDLQLVLAGLFDLVTKKNKQNSSVQSKQVEDFRITFRADVDLDSDFQTKYGGTLAKYSICDIPNVQHGRVC